MRVATEFASYPTLPQILVIPYKILAISLIREAGGPAWSAGWPVGRLTSRPVGRFADWPMNHRPIAILTHISLTQIWVATLGRLGATLGRLVEQLVRLLVRPLVGPLV